jgi:outer membrane protein OmpA-like peptidoglycan-associated protein
MFSEEPNRDEYNPWISYTDLAMSLMIIFAVVTMVSVASKSEGTQSDDISNEPVIVIDTIVVRAFGKYIELTEVFEYAFANKDEIVVADSATIRFWTRTSAHKSLFRPDDHKPTSRFKKLLDLFFPVFLREVHKIWSENSQVQITEIRIEGHTDSDAGHAYNLPLSSKRAVKVQLEMLKYARGKYSEDFLKFLTEKSVAVGYADTRLLDGHGKQVRFSKNPEDKDKSRRVEFRILLEDKP